MDTEGLELNFVKMEEVCSSDKSHFLPNKVNGKVHVHRYSEVAMSSGCPKTTT